LRGLKFQVVTAFGRAARWHLQSVSPFLPWRRVVTATPRRHFPRELLRRSVRPCLRHQRALRQVLFGWRSRFADSPLAVGELGALSARTLGSSMTRGVRSGPRPVGDGATQQNAVAGVTGSSKSAACSFPGAHARSDRAASDDACMKNFSTAR